MAMGCVITLIVARLSRPLQSPAFYIAYPCAEFSDITLAMDHVRKHFKKVDPILHAAIAGKEWYTLTRTHDHFMGLCRIIIGQQVSTKAAQSIFNKFCELFPKKKPTAKAVLSLTDAQIRSAGLSTSKTNAVRDLALRVENKSLPLKKIPQMSNEEISIELVKVRGIGSWSAEMFLMFYLTRVKL